MTDELQSLQDEIQDRIHMAREAIADAGMSGDWQHAQSVAESAKHLPMIRQVRWPSDICDTWSLSFYLWQNRVASRPNFTCRRHLKS